MIWRRPVMPLGLTKMLAINCGGLHLLPNWTSKISHRWQSFHSIEAQSKELKKSFKRSYDEHINELQSAQEELATCKGDLGQRMESGLLNTTVLFYIVTIELWNLGCPSSTGEGKEFSCWGQARVDQSLGGWYAHNAWPDVWSTNWCL